MSKENPTNFQKDMMSYLENGIIGSNTIRKILKERGIKSFPLGDADIPTIFTADETMAAIFDGIADGAYNELRFPYRGDKRIKSSEGKEMAEGVIEKLLDVDYGYDLQNEVEGELYG